MIKENNYGLLGLHEYFGRKLGIVSIDYLTKSFCDLVTEEHQGSLNGGGYRQRTVGLV